MPTTHAPEMLSQAPIASLTPIDLDNLDATDFLQTLLQQPRLMPPHLVVDCSQLKCLRSLGVSYVVSQLLVFHRSGARVFLRNVEPVLQRCLRLLRLDNLFPNI